MQVESNLDCFVVTLCHCHCMAMNTNKDAMAKCSARKQPLGEAAKDGSSGTRTPFADPASVEPSVCLFLLRVR